MIAEPGRFYSMSSSSLFVNVIAKTAVPAGRITDEGLKNFILLKIHLRFFIKTMQDKIHYLHLQSSPWSKFIDHWPNMNFLLEIFVFFLQMMMTEPGICITWMMEFSGLSIAFRFMIFVHQEFPFEKFENWNLKFVEI